MKLTFKNIFASKSDDIPKQIEKTFKASFKHPVSVEWIQTGLDFEALFYEDNKEKIARFSKDGNITEIRINHLPQEFPASQKTNLNGLGTIMNFIEISKAGLTNYELIIKKHDFARILVILNDRYEIIKQESL